MPDYITTDSDHSQIIINNVHKSKVNRLSTNCQNIDIFDGAKKLPGILDKQRIQRRA